MYCSTCGARLVEGRTRCDTCGALTDRRLAEAPRFGRSPVAAAICPRCGYRGEGIPYFSRGTHVAAAIGITLLTSGIMGVGGLIYYLIRRDHLVCPRCGRGWGKDGVVALVHAAQPSQPAPPPVPVSSGGGKQALSIIAYLFAAFLVVLGIAVSEIGPIVGAGLAATAGIALQQAAAHDRERRREALLSALQLPVLQLAGRKGGQLTVSEVAAELGWTMKRAEKVLQSMDDGLRVTSEVTDEGVIVYEFPELMRAGRRLTGGQKPGELA